MAAAFNLSQVPGLRRRRPTTPSSATRAGSTRATSSRSAGSGSAGSARSSSTTTKVLVTFEVDDGVEFGTESQASIEVLNLLGEKYLDLTPAGTGQLDEDDAIPVDRTESAYDIVGVFGDLTDHHRADRHRPARPGARRRRRHDQPVRARDRRPASTGIARLSQSVASRDEQIQSLLRELARASASCSADRSDGHRRPDGDSDLVFEELEQRKAGHPPAAGQRPRSSPIELRGVADGQPGADRPGAEGGRRPARPARSQGEGAQGDPRRRSVPTSSILSNIIGTGPWFDAYAVNLAAIPTGEFLPGPRGRDGDDTPALRIEPADRDRSRRGRCPARRDLPHRAPATSETKTVTAHFPRAVSVYEGTDVRILGVNVGRVTAVIPEGNSVRVEMEYDARVRRARRTPRP